MKTSKLLNSMMLATLIASSASFANVWDAPNSTKECNKDRDVCIADTKAKFAQFVADLKATGTSTINIGRINTALVLFKSKDVRFVELHSEGTALGHFEYLSEQHGAYLGLPGTVSDSDAKFKKLVDLDQLLGLAKDDYAGRLDIDGNSVIEKLDAEIVAIATDVVKGALTKDMDLCVKEVRKTLDKLDDAVDIYSDEFDKEDGLFAKGFFNVAEALDVSELTKGKPAPKVDKFKEEIFKQIGIAAADLKTTTTQDAIVNHCANKKAEFVQAIFDSKPWYKMVKKLNADTDLAI